ncbi:MAG: flavin reductase [Caulobacterales bacterium]
MADFDPREFRNALGAFATGVTVVTTSNAEGEPFGVTASSFNSVSLDPPLVLWSLGRSSKSFPAFVETDHFAVHVLADHQQDLSNAFAKSGHDKFAGVAWRPGVLSSPVLPDCAARFECRTLHQYEGGDHIIFVGEVVHFERLDAAPLVFHGGRYADARPRPSEGYASGVDPGSLRFTDDFVLYLLALAHFQSNAPARRRLADIGLSQGDYFALTAIALGVRVTLDQLQARLEHTGAPPTLESIAGLVAQGYIERDGDGFVMTLRGRDVVIDSLSQSKAAEQNLLASFSVGEIAELKRLLKKLIASTGEPDPRLWDE